MILYEIFGDERHPAYRQLSTDNLRRQYDFLRSIVNTVLSIGHTMISTSLVRALNYHAISCLHVNAGEYRPCPVTVGAHHPPDHYRVPEMMESFINEVNRFWDGRDALVLAAYCLWRLNYIHPFINGNGRTARDLCYFVVCVKADGWLPGQLILPELIRQNHDEYVSLLRSADDGFKNGKQDYLEDLQTFLSNLLRKQLQSIQTEV